MGAALWLVSASPAQHSAVSGNLRMQAERTTRLTQQATTEGEQRHQNYLSEVAELERTIHKACNGRRDNRSS